jgi:ankyrin repeat protein
VCVGIKDGHGEPPLVMCIVYNRVKLAKLLIEKGAELDVHDDKFKTPLMYIAEANDEVLNREVAPMIVGSSRFTAINKQDEEGRTALYLAGE